MYFELFGKIGENFNFETLTKPLGKENVTKIHEHIVLIPRASDTVSPQNILASN